MCGRFASSVPSEELARLFRVDAVEEDLPPPSWNVSPTRIARVVAVVDGTRELAGFRWGLIPRWADDPSIGSRMINARAETLERRPAFREAFRRRRCLVPVDGFYEWAGRRPDGRRQPWFVAPRDRGVLALAGRPVGAVEGRRGDEVVHDSYRSSHRGGEAHSRPHAGRHTPTDVGCVVGPGHRRPRRRAPLARGCAGRAASRGPETRRHPRERPAKRRSGAPRRALRGERPWCRPTVTNS